MRACLNSLAALAATWALLAGVAEARCDLTDPTSAAAPSAASPAVPAQPEAARSPDPLRAQQAFSAPPREPILAAPPQRSEPRRDRSVSPGPRAAIPDTVLMRKHGIL